ncbi:hypothetical protein, partial [Acinetobacter baumannii]|uniref:hypothetical protein n=1 Tax=Acinetobacter baumannii TaxID=470 RepID=UPI002FE341FC
MKFTIKLSQAAAEVVDSLTNRELLDQVCCPTYTRVGPNRTETFGAMFFHPTEREELEQQIERFQSR